MTRSWFSLVSNMGGYNCGWLSNQDTLQKTYGINPVLPLNFKGSQRGWSPWEWSWMSHFFAVWRKCLVFYGWGRYEGCCTINFNHHPAWSEAWKAWKTFTIKRTHSYCWLVGPASSRKQAARERGDKFAVWLFLSFIRFHWFRSVNASERDLSKITQLTVHLNPLVVAAGFLSHFGVWEQAEMPPPLPPCRLWKLINTNSFSIWGDLNDYGRAVEVLKSFINKASDFPFIAAL